MHSKIVQISKDKSTSPLNPDDLPGWFFYEGYADYAAPVAPNYKEGIYKWFARTPGTNYNATKRMMHFNPSKLIDIKDMYDFEIMYFYVSDEFIEEESRLMSYREFIELLSLLKDEEYDYYVIDTFDYHF